ncbi:MAG: NAD(P)/FAD-dependent oxidoreductase [Hyphomonadaceae bacterium]
MWDCVIVGGGPAGLTAATYLGRFCRRVLVIDAGESRMKRIPLSRNAPGFPDGVSGAELHDRMLRQASGFGASFKRGRVEALRTSSDRFTVLADGAVESARSVLLATGAQLTEPSVPDLDAALHRGLIRYCPICDGFETRGRRIAVLGGRPGALQEARFLRTFSDRVTYHWMAEASPGKTERQEAELHGIKVADAPVMSVDIDVRVRIRLTNGQSESFDVLYPSLGCTPRSQLAQSLHARVSSEGGIEVDAHQRTSVRGLYAAGDVLQGLDQIASACGQAATAATDLHNALREADEAMALN